MAQSPAVVLQRPIVLSVARTQCVPVMDSAGVRRIGLGRHVTSTVAHVILGAKAATGQLMRTEDFEVNTQLVKALLQLMSVSASLDGLVLDVKCGPCNAFLRAKFVQARIGKIAKYV